MAALVAPNGGWKAADPHLPAAVQLLFITRPGIEILGTGHKAPERFGPDDVLPVILRRAFAITQEST